MRWLLLFITLIFIIKCVDSFKKQLQEYRPDSYFLGRGIPGHLGNVPNFLQLVGGRVSLSVRNPHREYPIDFQSLLQRLENKIALETLDKDELKFITDASGVSCSHGAKFTVDPYPEHKQECQTITCFCITKNSYLCSYESNCTALLTALSPKENDLSIPEYEDESGKKIQAENITSDEYYDEDGNEEGDNDEEQEEETYQQNQEVYEDEGESEEDDQEEENDNEAKDEHKNIFLCEKGSIHRLNNFHIPPCMVCLCLDHWTMFCTTKSLKLCLYDNNRDESGQIITDERVLHKTGLLNDVDILKSALDEITALKDWTEEKKLYDK